MRSPKIKKSPPLDHRFILDAAFRKGWKDACCAFQSQLRKERAQMKKLAESGNAAGCFCIGKCKVEECLFNH